MSDLFWIAYASVAALLWVAVITWNAGVLFRFDNKKSPYISGMRKKYFLGPSDDPCWSDYGMSAFILWPMVLTIWPLVLLVAACLGTGWYVANRLRDRHHTDNQMKEVI